MSVLNDKMRELFKQILKEQIPELKLREENINFFVQSLRREFRENNIKSIKPGDIEGKIKSYLKNYFRNYVINKPNATFSKHIEEKYLRIYEDVLKTHHYEEDDKYKVLFYDILFYMIFHRKPGEHIEVSLKNVFRKELIKINQENTKNHVERTCNPSHAKDYEKPLIEQTFVGDIQVLHTVISAFDYEEQTLLRNIKKKEDITDASFYQSMQEKIESTMQYYFLLKWEGYSETEITTQLSCEIRRHFPKRDLELLQEKFYKGFLLPNNLVKLHLQAYFQKENVSAEKLQIFLGMLPYSISCSSQEIIAEARTWMEKENNNYERYKKKYSIFQKFQFKKERVLLIFQCLKNEKPELYEVLKKYHGERLETLNVPNEEDLDLYMQAIKEIRLILKQEKEGKVIIDSTDFLIILNSRNGVFRHFPELDNMSIEEKNVYKEKIHKKYQLLKTINLEYYKIIKKRNGESLLEWNDIENEERPLYHNAINKLRDMVRVDKKYKTEELLSGIFHLFPELDNMSIEEKNVYKERICKKYQLLKTINLEYYKIIKKRNGESLLEWNDLSKVERPLYYNAIDKLRDMVRIDKKNRDIFHLFPEINEMSEEERNAYKEKISKKYQLLKTINLEYYKIIKKRNGESLLEWNDLSKVERGLYYNAIDRLRDMVRLDKKNRDIFHFFLEMEEMSEEERNAYIGKIHSIFHLLETIKLDYYKIIKKQHGESLLEWNGLSKEKRILYKNAIAKLKMMVRFEKNGFFEHFPEMKEMSKEEQEKYIEKLQKNIYLLKLLYPPFYDMVIKCRGKNLTKAKYLGDEEFFLYLKAIKEIKRINTSEYFRKSSMFVKESLLNQKKFLSYIKLRRRKVSSSDISRQMNIPFERLYQIYAQNLLLFGEMVFEIIEEILTNSEYGSDYLNESSQFTFLFENLPEEGRKYYQELLLQNGTDFSRLKVS